MADGGDEAYGQGLIWACEECGREHQKNSPPCKRCGHVHLEQRRPDYSDIEPSGQTSYFDVLEPKYALGYLAVIAFAIVVVLSLTGVISVPWLGGPSPPGAPGDAETYENVSLSGVEDAFVDAVNSRRTSARVGSLSVGSSLDGAATAINQRRVRAAVDGDAPPDVREILRAYEPDCQGDVLIDRGTDPVANVFGEQAGDRSAASVAARLGIAPGDGQSGLFDAQFGSIGVDVHVGPDGTVYSTVLVC